MAVNELAWRKFPRDTMRNEDLDYCSYLLPDNLKPAPFLFFTTAYCKADDDGVFDIENGVIFSRLMRIGKPEDVINIAQMLEERRIIQRVIPGANIFMITDWEVPARPGNYTQKSRTAEERRMAVAAKINAEIKAKAAAAAPVQVNFSRPAANDNFFCADVDKNAKNVVIQRERETEIRENRETHTQTEETEQTERLREETRERSEDLRASTALQSNRLESTVEPQTTESTQSIAAQALQGSGAAVESNAGEVQSEKESADCIVVCEVFNTFFAKNCLGYSPEYNKADVNKLAQRIVRLKDEKNPPGIIASVFCTQFKALSDNPGHFQNVPITPQMMLNPNVYAQVCSRASKVLLTKGKSSEWDKQMRLEELEAEADRERVYIETQKDCLRYGIAEDDPQRMFKIMLAKKKEKEQLNE